MRVCDGENVCVRESKYVCVSVCVCVCEREREKKMMECLTKNRVTNVRKNPRC